MSGTFFYDFANCSVNVSSRAATHTVPTRKTRFFTAHFTKLAVTPMVFEIPKCNVPHLKDLKQGFRFQLKTFRKLQG